MLIINTKTKEKIAFSYFKHLKVEIEINELDRLNFEIPKEYRYLFDVEFLIIEDMQEYVVKNIEPFYGGFKIECKANNIDWLEKFNKSLNFPYKKFEDVLIGIMPDDWNYEVLEAIDERRTITADHKSSWEVFLEAVGKYDIEYRLDPYFKNVVFGKKMFSYKDFYLDIALNVEDKDIEVESFEFATRIVPEGMNGLKINQINNGKDYLEDKSFNDRTITYYWKDERYTNIENLKKEAERKLKILSKPKTTIKIKVKDLRKAIGVQGPSYVNKGKLYDAYFDVGDYVYLLDNDRKTKERFRVVRMVKYPYRKMDNEITLSNKPKDIVDDMNETIELTKEMWEETRVRFETTENAIKSSVATAKRYTDDSFKTYKTEREQTDSRIYESITESTTYVDPKTGQTKPIIDKQLEIDKTIDGINISLRDQLTANKDFNLRLDNLRTNISENTLSLNSKIDKDLAKAKKELGESIDYTKIDFKKRHDLLALELEKANNDINKAKEKISGLSNNFDDFNTRANNKYEVIDREILGIKSNFKVARDEISSEIASASKTQEKAIKEMGDNTESKIKTFLNLNYSTTTQTDEKITKEVGMLGSSIGKDMSNLNREVIEAKSMVEQTQRGISAIVSNVESGLDEKIKNLNARVNIQADSIESKVSKNGFGSLVKQEFDKYKIEARNIDFDGSYISAKGTFQTMNDSNDVGVKISYNKIEWRDNRWDGKVFGAANVTRLVGTQYGFSLNYGHYQTGYLGLSYWHSDDQTWYDYITLDRWNYTGDGYQTPIIFNENINCKYNALRLGKWEIVAEGNQLKIKPIDSKSGFLFTKDAGLKYGLYSYYADKGKDMATKIATVW